MRCHKPIKFVILTCLLAAGGCSFTLWAQSGPIFLIQNSQGQPVYINASPGRSSSASFFDAAGRSPGNGQSASLAIPKKLQGLIERTASRFQVDPKLVDAIIRVESEYNPQAVSPKGAMGLMQLIPATAERFRVGDPFDPGQNIQGGVTFLKYLLDRFNGSIPLSVAAYNAGENRVEHDGGVPAIPETLQYVRKVTSLYDGTQVTPSSHDRVKANADPIYHYVDEYGVVHYTND